MSKALNCELHEILAPVNGRVRRYLHCIVKTWRLLRRYNADVIFAQNPSIVLAMLVVLYGRLFGKKTVIDCHNWGLFPAEGSNPFLNWLAAQIPRQSDLTIVTNESLSMRVRELGGTPFVLPDPVPNIETSQRVTLSGAFTIFFICTYADDEPYHEVFRAAAMLGNDIQIYVSGDFRKMRGVSSPEIAQNVHLTGYLTNDVYAATLIAADVVIDLTYRRDCLVCGAYEAIACGKPLLLSADPCAEALFDRGVLFTDNSAADIVNKIQELRRDHDLLSRGISQLKVAMIDTEARNFTALEQLLSRPEH